MPAAVAVPAAISAGTSIFGGIMGASAAKKAAATQQQAAQQQAQQFQQTLNQYNPAVMSTAQQAAQGATTAAQTAGQNLTDTAQQAAAGVTGAATQANQFLQPYQQLGEQAAQSLAGYMAPGGDLNRNFTFQDMQSLDPGYQFRIDQANKALAGSAAARGGALGGGAIRAAMGLSQNLASSEYGAAFDRFRSQQTDRFNRFSNLMDMGARTGQVAGQNLMTAAQLGGGWTTGAAQQAGGWGTQAAQYGGSLQQQAAEQQAQNAFGAQRSIADLMTGAAEAQAAGQMGSANAWAQGLGGVANAAQQVGRYYQEKDLMDQAQQGGYGGYPPPTGFTPYNVAVQGRGYYTPSTPQLPTLGPPPAYNNPSLMNWMQPGAAPLPRSYYMEGPGKQFGYQNPPYA